jgi:hypothetical protein
MTTILLIFLFIMQIISFYFLSLLYMKVTQFDELEKKQQKLMVEMDDSLGAYLSELKDENERLVERLTERDNYSVVEKQNNNTIVAKEIAVSEETQPVVPVNKPKMPINLVLKSYAATTAQGLKLTAPEVEDDRFRIYKLHDAGHPIEEIAKKLGKGRTEIELILKFR